MQIVSNTSPILNLAIINRLDLLQKQFSKVIIPEAVFAELKAELILLKEKAGFYISDNLFKSILATLK